MIIIECWKCCNCYRARDSQALGDAIEEAEKHGWHGQYNDSISGLLCPECYRKEKGNCADCGRQHVATTKIICKRAGCPCVCEWAGTATMDEARDMARHVGWSVRDGREYCPYHTLVQ